jgi:DNA-directed RNA polymerase specialized sigma24 family protein
MRSARQSRRPTPVAEIAEANSAATSEEPPDDNLWSALRALPAKQRQAVAYHHVAGLSYAEVATIIGGSTDAARRAAPTASAVSAGAIATR